MCAISCSADRRSLWLGAGTGSSWPASLVLWFVCLAASASAVMTAREGRVWPLALLTGLLGWGAGLVVLRHLRLERWYFGAVVLLAGGGAAAVALGLLPQPQGIVIALAAAVAWSVVSFGTAPANPRSASAASLRFASLAVTAYLAAIALHAIALLWISGGLLILALASLLLLPLRSRQPATGRSAQAGASGPSGAERAGPERGQPTGADLAQAIVGTLRLVGRCATRFVRVALGPLAIGTAWGLLVGWFALRLGPYLGGSTGQSRPEDALWLVLLGAAIAAVTAALVWTISRLGAAWAALADLSLRAAGIFAVVILLGSLGLAVAAKDFSRLGPCFWGSAVVLPNGVALAVVLSRFRRRALLFDKGRAEARATPAAPVAMPWRAAWPGVLLALLTAMAMQLQSLTAPANDLWSRGAAGAERMEASLGQAVESARRSMSTRVAASSATAADPAHSTSAAAGQIAAPRAVATEQPVAVAQKPPASQGGTAAGTTGPSEIAREGEKAAEQAGPTPASRIREHEKTPVTDEQTAVETGSPVRQPAPARTPLLPPAPDRTQPVPPEPALPVTPTPTPKPEPVVPAIEPPQEKPAPQETPVPQETPLPREPPVRTRPAAPARHPRMGQVYTFSVAPGGRWVDTGLELFTGQVIGLSASGDILTGSGDGGRSGPAGLRSLVCQGTGCALEGARYGALVARVEGRRPFFVGAGRSLEIRSGGRLYLGVNDEAGGSAVGSGGYRVQVKIIR